MQPKTCSLPMETNINVPGVTTRGFCGTKDYPAMVDIYNGSNKANDEEEIITIQDMINTYDHIQRSDVSSDMLFIEINGKPVGYGRCMWDAEENGDHLYTFFLNMKQEGRRDDIVRPVIEGFIKRLTEMAAQHAADVPKYYQSWALESGTWYTHVLDEMGFEKVRYDMAMIRPCSQPVEVNPLPEGVEVRPVNPEDYRAVFDAESEAFRDHWGYVAPTEKDYQAFLERPTFNPALWKVAWDGDQVVGMVRNFIHKEENEKFNRKRGYTENISVRRPWRRKGVARSLLTQSIKMFQEMGMEETALGVDTENPNGAKGLYESVGYQETKRHITYRKKFN